MSASRMRLAYITSMVTGGLAGFNFRELNEMKRLEADISLFITKFIPGPYMPPNRIRWYSAKASSIILSQPKLFLFSPISYFKLLAEGIYTNTVVDFLIAQKWAAIMKRWKAGWIHCHWGDHKLFIGYYCHMLTEIPLSVTLHGYDLYANPNLNMLERSLNACAQIITISDHNKRLLEDRYGELGKKVKVIRLSADLPPDPESMRNITRLLAVGGFQPRKGYDTLLQGLHILNRDDIHLWVVGYKGPVDVPKMVKDFGLNDRVTIFGHVSDEVLKLLYVYCDIFCMPSRFGPDGVGEGLPVSLMEAMSYAKPIVSTYHTGIPELVPDILVEENDARGLAKGIARLADDPALRYKMGKRNREIVSNDYSNANVATLLNALKLED